MSCLLISTSPSRSTWTTCFDRSSFLNDENMDL
jgi:hypothetical protein